MRFYTRQYIDANIERVNVVIQKLTQEITQEITQEKGMLKNVNIALFTTRLYSFEYNYNQDKFKTIFLPYINKIC